MEGSKLALASVPFASGLAVAEYTKVLLWLDKTTYHPCPPPSGTSELPLTLTAPPSSSGYQKVRGSSQQKL